MIKVTNGPIAAGLLAVVLYGSSMAGEASTESLSQPLSSHAAPLDYDAYLFFPSPEESSESPSDRPGSVAEESKPEKVASAETCPGCCHRACCEEESCGACDPCGCDSRCGGGCGCCCDLGDPWTLFGENCCGSKVGGWISAGIYGNQYGERSNGPLGFNNVGDGFTFNQLWIFGEKAADTGGYGLDWGFRVDYVFGVDGPDTQAFGGPLGTYDFGWNSSRDYGSALPQLYGEVAINNLTVKFGHFYTIIGWEVVAAPDNFFYSHAYTMYYGEPFTHTGVLASYALGDVTVHGGWTQGWDTGFDNTFEADTFLGGFSLPVTENATFTWAVSAGDLGTNAGDVYMNSLVLQWNLTEKLTYIFHHDLGTIDGPASAEWYGVNQYLLYQFSDCWAVGGRFEWFRDNEGSRVIHDVGTSRGDYYEATLGLNWKPHANVVIRPEIRYDWLEGAAAPGTRPYNAGADTEQFSGGFDLVVTY